MEIILLEDIDHVGKFGERVKVKPGYARNYLLPQGKATTVTPDNLARFELRREELARKAADRVEQARVRAEVIHGRTLTVDANVGSEGRLFGSVGAADIVRALADRGITVERSEIRLPDGPIRVVGEYAVEARLSADTHAELTVIVRDSAAPDSAGEDSAAGEGPQDPPAASDSVS